jgi:hypothetical protein
MVVRQNLIGVPENSLTGEAKTNPQGSGKFYVFKR